MKVIRHDIHSRGEQDHRDRVLTLALQQFAASELRLAASVVLRRGDPAEVKHRTDEALYALGMVSDIETGSLVTN